MPAAKIPERGVDAVSRFASVPASDEQLNWTGESSSSLKSQTSWARIALHEAVYQLRQRAGLTRGLRRGRGWINLQP